MKKLRLRFIAFFVGGLFCFILFMGLFVMLCSEYVIPRFAENELLYDMLHIFAILISFVVGGILLGLFFVNPFIYMLSLISELSRGAYSLEDMDGKLYQSGGRLKKRYFLYRELISDIYKLAHQLETAQRARRKLEEEKTKWLAGVSHDLKTPLSYITGYSSLLLDREKDWTDSEQMKFMEEIHDKSVVIADLIGDLNLSFKLDTFGDTCPLHKQVFDLVDFSKRLLADIMNNPKAAGYEFAFRGNADTIEINADEKLLYRAVQNVVMNAVLHNPKETNIELAISEHTDENTVSVTIADNGIGMSSAAAVRLFDRYYHGEDTENISGGLGLSVVKSIVEAHRGMIQAESSQGKGTAIYFTLPKE